MKSSLVCKGCGVTQYYDGLIACREIEGDNGYDDSIPLRPKEDKKITKHSHQLNDINL